MPFARTGAEVSRIGDGYKKLLVHWFIDSQPLSYIDSLFIDSLNHQVIGSLLIIAQKDHSISLWDTRLRSWLTGRLAGLALGLISMMPWQKISPSRSYFGRCTIWLLVCIPVSKSECHEAPVHYDSWYCCRTANDYCNLPKVISIVHLWSLS